MEDRWEQLRQTMRWHFVVKGMKLEEVMVEMANRGFHASKATYERRFRTWGFHKNLKDSEWKYLGRQIKKRKRAGKESDVYYNGAIIPKKKILKETARHDPPLTDVIPKTPEGLYICTPPSSSPNVDLLCDLPWFQFQNQFKPFLGLKLDSGLDLASLANLLVSTRSNELRWKGNESGLSKPISSEPEDLLTSALGIWTASITTTGQNSTVRQVHSYLRAIVPDQVGDCLLGDVEQLRGSSDMSAIVPYVNVAVYLVSNNMVDGEALIKIIQYFQQTRDVLSLKSLLSIKMPTTEALAEKLFIGAVRTQDHEIAQVTLDAGANPNVMTIQLSCPPLLYVVRKDDLQLVDILLKAGADANAPSPDSYGTTALLAAAERGNIELARLLLEASADVNAPPAGHRGRNVLQAAAGQGNIELVQLLLEAGADINALPASRKGRTALQEAAEQGHFELVQLLLDAGANVDSLPACDEGRTALQAAAGRGSIEVIELLLNAGADVNVAAANIKGITALQAAAIQGYVGIALKLLRCGADVNAPAARVFGRTALEGAAEHGRIDMVRLLLNAGAEYSGREVDLASSYGHHAVVRVFERYTRVGGIDGMRRMEKA